MNKFKYTIYTKRNFKFLKNVIDKIVTILLDFNKVCQVYYYVSKTLLE